MLNVVPCAGCLRSVLCPVQAACAQYSAEEVMASMVECALKEEETLKRITAAVDLQRDAAELK